MKKPKAPKIVTVSIFTTATIIFWVFVSLYNVLTSKPKVDVAPELLDPIDPVLDTESLDRLTSKIFYDAGSIEETLTPTPQQKSFNPTPTTKPTPSATETPQPEQITEEGV